MLSVTQITAAATSFSESAEEPRTRQLHRRFDKFIDEAIWEGFTLAEIEAIAPDVFKDYEKFLTSMHRVQQIG